MRINTSTMSSSLATSTGFGGGGKFLGKTGEEWGSSLATGAVVGAAALGVFGLGTLAIDMIGGGGSSSSSDSDQKQPPCIYMLPDGRMLQVPQMQVPVQVPMKQEVPQQPGLMSSYVQQVQAPAQNPVQVLPVQAPVQIPAQAPVKQEVPQQTDAPAYATKDDLDALKNSMLTALSECAAQQEKINAEAKAAAKPATTGAAKPATEAGKVK